MLDKINIGPIVLDHFHTLRNYITGRLQATDFLILFGAPIALAAVAALRGFSLHSLAVNALVASFSVFAAILLALLPMIFSFVQSTERKTTDSLLATRRRLLREIIANICFAILIAVVVVAIALISLSTLKKDQDPVSELSTFLLIAGSAIFLLNMLMVVKRMYLLMLNELDIAKRAA